MDTMENFMTRRTHGLQGTIHGNYRGLSITALSDPKDVGSKNDFFPPFRAKNWISSYAKCYPI